MATHLDEFLHVVEDEAVHGVHVRLVQVAHRTVSHNAVVVVRQTLLRQRLLEVVDGRRQLADDVAVTVGVLDDEDDIG